MFLSFMCDLLVLVWGYVEENIGVSCVEFVIIYVRFGSYGGWGRVSLWRCFFSFLGRR